MSTNNPSPAAAARAVYCSNCGFALNGTEAYCPKCAAAQPHAGVPLQAQARPTTYAGFWLRFIAIFIDGIIINLVMTPFVLAFLIPAGFMIRPGQPPDPEQAIRFMMPFLWISVLSLVANWLYEALMMSSSKRATLGKMVFGIIVVDTEGRQLTFARATGRHFAKWISGMTFLIGYIIAGFTARKQALHDFIAGTLVLRQQ